MIKCKTHFLVSARKRLAGLGIETRETTEIPWADRFYIRDPNGNRIEIIQILE